jgi:hypothetical protein
VTSTHFNFGYQPELWIRVIEPQMPQQTMMHLTILHPKGWAAFTDDAAFTLDPTGGPGMMHPATGQAMRMNVVTPVPGGVALDRGIPLPGTPMIRFPEEGDFQVQATVDGLPGMLATTMSVVFTR